MSLKKGALASLALSLAISTGPVIGHAAEDGLITKPSKYSVKETVTRFEHALKQKEEAGFTVFTRSCCGRQEIRPRHASAYGHRDRQSEARNARHGQDATVGDRRAT